MIVPLLIGATSLAVLGAARRRAVQAAQVAAPVPARLIRFPGLLGPYRNAQVFASTIARDPDLQPSTVTGGVDGYRRSQVLWHGEEVAPDISVLVREMAPALCRALGVAPFPIGTVENQVTVSRGGDFFKEHDDNGSPETATRRLSWVYYVTGAQGAPVTAVSLQPSAFSQSALRAQTERTPRQGFTGGELVMLHAPGGGSYVVQPENDMLICFPSDVRHEVMPVRTASQDARDARITVNGWVREAV